MFISGESKLRPREFEYLRSIISRTSSTRSSSLTVTRVGDAWGRLTQILRVTIFPFMGAYVGGCVMLGSCVDWFERSVLIKVVWRFDSKLCRLGGGAGRAVGEPGTERIPDDGRPGDGVTKFVEVAAAKGANATDLGEFGAWSRLNGSSSLCPASSEAASKSKLATALERAVGDSKSESESCASS